MDGTRYRRGRIYSGDMQAYFNAMAETNDSQMDQLRNQLSQALREDVTPRQRQVLYLYYVRQLNMRQIGELLLVDCSTVSRTIRRGEDRLRRCLRYSNGNLLGQAGEKRGRNHR